MALERVVHPASKFAAIRLRHNTTLAREPDLGDADGNVWGDGPAACAPGAHRAAVRPAAPARRRAGVRRRGRELLREGISPLMRFGCNRGGKRGWLPARTRPMGDRERDSQRAGADGYDPEHNFGHGCRSPADMPGMPNPSAFAAHTACDRSEAARQRARRPRRKQAPVRAHPHACRPAYMVLPSRTGPLATPSSASPRPMPPELLTNLDEPPTGNAHRIMGIAGRTADGLKTPPYGRTMAPLESPDKL